MSAGFKLSFRLKGDAAVKQRLKELGQQYPTALGTALFEAGEAIKADTVARAPEQTGYLRDSAFVNAPVMRDGQVVVQVGFGAKYSTYQHEMTRLQHSIGAAKFLGGALQQRSATLLSDLVQRTRENIGRGATALPHSDNRGLNDRPAPVSVFRKAMKARRSRK